MTQHTPGPWEPTSDNHFQLGVEALGCRSICHIVGTTAVDEANANLIAAAPDLLASLEWSTRIIESLLSGSPEISKLEGYDCLSSNQAAIAKARAS